MNNNVPQVRITDCNWRPVRAEGEFVLYWMIASRRLRWNFALERAVEIARELKKPLVVMEALRCDYRWASDRLHRFVLQGMANNAEDFSNTSARYYPYLEPSRGAGNGLIEAMAERACCLVTDDYPCFFLPKMVQIVAGQVAIRVEAVDSNGLLPMRAADKVFLRAVDFRRFLQRELRPHLEQLPKTNPLARIKLPAAKLPQAITRQWRPATKSELTQPDRLISNLQLDHGVGPAIMTGGRQAAQQTLQSFLKQHLESYGQDRNQPDDNGSSGLSPYLHFGHISVHEIFASLVRREPWAPERMAVKSTGKREGWWGLSPPAEAFLDQLVTWRELGFSMSWQRDDYFRYSSLPDWARETLAVHQKDSRDYLYSPEQLESAATHDELWNAAQRQLVREGRLHNYLRMLWGKKVLEWTARPQDALKILIHLNNKYAVDGRDPNSYSGVFWVFGRYDRPWAPERPIFGRVRYMSSENTRKKLRVKEYLKRYAA